MAAFCDTAALPLPMMFDDDHHRKSTECLNDNEKPRKKRKTLNQNPDCNWCGSDNVANVDAHSVGKRVYKCKTCSKKWQQIPPVMLKPDQDPEIQECSTRVVKGGGYKCKACGQLKKIRDPTGKNPPVSHKCPKKKEKKVKTTILESATIITQTKDNYVQAHFPENPVFPGVYQDAIFPEETLLQSFDFYDTCIVCDDVGTHYAGDPKSFLKCTMCSKVIHYHCLEEFCTEWSCSSCKYDDRKDGIDTAATGATATAGGGAIGTAATTGTATTDGAIDTTAATPTDGGHA
jgi:hypothetical protein